MKKNTHWVQTTKTITFGSKHKNHKCPMCNSKLVSKRNTRIIEPNSEQRRNVDLISGPSHTHMVGTGKYTSDEFYCENCKRFFLPKEIYDREKSSEDSKGAWLKKALPTIGIIIGFIAIILIGLLTNEESPFRLF